MIGRTNIKKQGLSYNNALIHVMAPIGSTIAFSKNDVVVKILDADKGHINSTETDFADWYYSINSSNYGEWSITSILNDNTANKIITVNNNVEYTVKLDYKLFLYKNGDLYTSTTGGWAASTFAPDNTNYGAQNPTISYETERVHVYSTTSYKYGAFLTVNKINVDKYSTAFIRALRPTGTANGWVRFVLSSYNSGKSHPYVASTDITVSSDIVEQTIDISNITGSYYIGLQVQGNALTSGYLYNCYIYEITLLI